MLRLFLLFALLQSNLLFASDILTLEQAYQHALLNIESIAIAKSKTEQANDRIAASRGKFLPKLSANIDWQKQDPSAKNVTNYNTPEAGIRLTYSLFNGGRDLLELDSLKTSAASHKQNVDQIKIDLYSSIATSFFQVQAAEQDLLNIEKSKEILNTRIQELNKRIAIGKAREIEILSSEAQLAVLESQLIIAKSDLLATRNYFSYLTGLSKDTKLKSPKEDPIILDQKTTYLEAINRLPEIASLKLNIENAQVDIKMAKSEHLPSLNFTGNYYLQRNQPKKDNHWDIGINLNLPIFSGGITSAHIQEAKGKETESILRLNETLRLNESKINTAYNNVEAKLEQLKVLKIALNATEKNYLALARDYRYSLTTNLEVLQALNSFQDTKRSYDKVRFDSLIALEELRALAGKVPL